MVFESLVSISTCRTHCQGGIHLEDLACSSARGSLVEVRLLVQDSLALHTHIVADQDGHRLAEVVATSKPQGEHHSLAGL